MLIADRTRSEPPVGWRLLRAKRRFHGSEKDRFETEHADFHLRIRDGYLEISEAEPERWLVVDGWLDSATISQIIWEHVIRRLDHLED